MAYKALYRTYRPQIFKDVCGQEVIVKTLQNAIVNQKISHAYLFCGPRGTGKTSIARIFAKALNCPNTAAGEPCNKCEICQEISEGYNPDVIEIDAASNNGVDEIRELREKVKFLPSGAKYRIYIVDEVHMLTAGAFNALLKTLEEPPKHIIFILATTEPQKLPATIVSRCQKFEFKALSVEDISERLKTICALEDVKITEEALNAIGEFAEGSMRDALGILDQAIAYGNKDVNSENINSVTGSLSFDRIIDLVQAIEKQDVQATLEILTELINLGKETRKIINSLLVFYRDVLLYKSVGSSGFDKYIFTKTEFQDFALNVPLVKIMYFLDVLSDLQYKIRYTSTPNVFLEISLIKMCNTSVEELDVMKRLSELENKIDDIAAGGIATGGGTADFERLNLVDTRLNQVITELNRLDLSQQIEKIDRIASLVGEINLAKIGEDNKNIEARIKAVEAKTEELCAKEKPDFDLSSFQEQIAALEAKLKAAKPENVNQDFFQQKIDQFKDELQTIKTAIVENKNTFAKLGERLRQIEANGAAYQDLAARIKDLEAHPQAQNAGNFDLSAMSDKLLALQQQIYKLTAEKLSDIRATKKSKKNERIMLFKNEIMSLDDFLKQEKSDAETDAKKVPNKQTIFDFINSGAEKEEKNKETIAAVETPKTNAGVAENAALKEIKEEKEANIEANISKAEKEVKEESLKEEIKADNLEAVKEDTLKKEEPESETLQETKPSAIPNANEAPEKQGLFAASPSQIFKRTAPKKENKIISQYFDADSGESVINKEFSSLIIKGKKEEKPHLEETTFSNELKQNQETEAAAEKEGIYSMKHIAQIMHDARAEEARNDKKRVCGLWKTLGDLVQPADLSIAQTLQQGEVAVVGKQEFIIVFSDVSLCNQVMRLKFRDEALRILYKQLGDAYSYVALPRDAWQKINGDYKNQYHMGIKYPVLQEWAIPGLDISEAQDEYKTEEERTIDETLKMFGPDNVNFE